MLAGALTCWLGLALTATQFGRTGWDSRLAAWAAIVLVGAAGIVVAWPGARVLTGWASGLGIFQTAALVATIGIPLIAQIWVTLIVLPATRVPSVTVDAGVTAGTQHDGARSVHLSMNMTNQSDVPLMLLGDMVQVTGVTVEVRGRPRTP